jgi:hypothetical protein
MMVSSLGRIDPQSQGLAPHAVTRLMRRPICRFGATGKSPSPIHSRISLPITRGTTRGAHQPLRPSARAPARARTTKSARFRLCPALDLGRSRRGDVPMGWRHTPGLTPRVFLCQSSLRRCTRPSGRFSARCRLDGTPPSPVHHMPRRNAGLQDCWMTRRGSVQEGVCRDAPSGRARYTSIFLGLLIGS